FPILEFNCRLGDPETQPMLLRLRTDLVELIEAALEGRLDTVSIDWDPRPSLGVVMAAAGYPDSYSKGHVISGLPQELPSGQKIFHAGTRLNDAGEVVTSGGRVLCVCSLGDTVADAQAKAYALVEQIHWEGAFYRRDIGYREIARERS